MADIIWPATLPQYVDQNGYQEARVSGKLETEMDSGPKSMRRLYTATPIVFSIQLTLTSTQVGTLDAFYYTTAKHGTLPFEWKHPRTGSTVDMRFLGDSPNYVHEGAEEFVTSFSVEVLP